MTRRPPAPFVAAVLSSRVRLSARLVRLTLRGDGIRELKIGQPASSIRVLLPGPDRPDGLELPSWDGNRFRLSDGRRPLIRTLTPRHHDAGQGALQVDVVVHGEGAAAQWASTAGIGTPVAVSGPARGYDLDPAAAQLIVGGDETAYGAVCSIVEAAPAHLPVSVFLEVESDDRPPAPVHPSCQVEWVSPTAGERPGASLVGRLGQVDLSGDVRLWAAGEAAAMQSLRQILFVDRGLPRTQATVRGYWKHGRASEGDGDTAG